MMTAIPAGYKMPGSKSSIKDGKAFLTVTYTNDKGEDRYIGAHIFDVGDSPKVLVEKLSSFAWKMGKYMVEHEEKKLEVKS